MDETAPAAESDAFFDVGPLVDPIDEPSAPAEPEEFREDEMFGGFFGGFF